MGEGLELAVAEARRTIHDNNVEGLRRLLAEYPALLTWQAKENDGGLLGMATWSYGDSGDQFREDHFTRLACAEVLLDDGAVVVPSVCDGVINSRAGGMIDLFHRRGLFPRTLKFFAALGDVDGIREQVGDLGFVHGAVVDQAAVNEALMYACHLQHADAAELLLDRAITLDPELGKNIDRGPGRSAFIQYFLADKPDLHLGDSFRAPWQSFLKKQIVRTLHEGDLASFVDGLQREAYLLSDEQVEFQVQLIEAAILHDRGPFIAALLDLNPALLHRRVPPPSQAIEFAFTCVKTHLLSLVLPIWPLPDDLPHAAGIGDLARVKHWLDADDLANHFPLNSPRSCSEYVDWFGERPGSQRVLDTALAWAILNNHFEVADFLLAHGADVNTKWCSHEPASILHDWSGTRTTRRCNSLSTAAST